MKKAQIKIAPISIAGAAIFPFSESLMKMGDRKSNFDEKYNMFRAFGPVGKQRIMVPRRMATGGEDLMTDGLDVSFNSLFVPRNDEQARVSKECKDRLKNGENFVARCPTGFGKTAIAMDVIAAIGKKTLVVVTKEDLRNQWIKACKKFLGLDPSEIGLIQGDKFQIEGKKVVIAMVQSLALEDRYPLHQMADFGLVIWDEVHRVAADHFSQSCFRCPARLRLGLSATPKRKDGKWEVVASHIGEVMVSSEALPLTPKVIIRKSPWVIPVVPVYDKKTNTTKVAPMPHTAGRCTNVLQLLAKHQGRNELLVSFIKAAFDKNRDILVQSEFVDHLEHLFAMCAKVGVPTSKMAYYIGGMKEAELDKAASKQVKFATYKMTAEGTDIPWVDALVLGLPRADVEQIVGRVVREYEDKPMPIVFDPVDGTSHVFQGYYSQRMSYYKKIGAEISFGPSH